MPSPPSANVGPSPQPATRQTPPDLLLVIFIHGFKGTDTTFGGFPNRLQHVLTETIESSVSECIVFPAYETKGELGAAVERFADWLTTLTVEREVAHGTGGGAGKARIVLCGHSMGGLLAADSLLQMVNSRPDERAPIWPNIIACIAFDTPYLGIHPYVFKNTITKAAEYVNTAQTVASSIFGAFAGVGAKKAAAAAPKTPQRALAPPPVSPSPSAWGTWAPSAYAVGGALIAGAAAAGTAYYKRDDLTSGYGWATDHMKYVGNLWDEEALRRRVDKLVEIEKKYGITFRTFYTVLPPSPPEHQSPRSFIVLPPKSSPSVTHFIPVRNSIATDELRAHTGLFSATSNDGYYNLGLGTARLVREAVMIGRGVVEGEAAEAVGNRAAGVAMRDAMKGMDVNEEKVSENLGVV